MQEPENGTNIEIKTRADPTFANYVELTYTKEINKKVKAKFFLIKYFHDKNREEDFLEFMLDNLEFYSLTEEERSKIKNSRQKIRKAYRRFVKNSNTGEFGEMILFFMLEVFENAVQIVNKMALKTSGKVHYHGADCIHFGFDGPLRVLYLGESKTTEQEFQIALSKSITSIREFYEEEKDKFEIDLISGNLSKDIPLEMRMVIEDFLDPTKPNKLDCCQANAVFLGFQESFLVELEKNFAGKELVEKVVEKYQEKIIEYINAIDNQVKQSSMSDKQFYFFMLPFKDLKRARDKFLKEVKDV